MAWQGKVASVVGTAVLTVSFYATDAVHRIESNPTALYMAGQFWVMAGERECGLELIERAARANKTNVPHANSDRRDEAAPQICSREPNPQQREAAHSPKVNAQPQLVAVKVSAPATGAMLIRASAAPTPPPGPNGFIMPSIEEFPMAPSVAHQFANVDEFVTAKAVVMRDGDLIIAPALEQRIRQIEAEAKNRAHQRVKILQRKAFQKQLESFAQRS